MLKNDILFRPKAPNNAENHMVFPGFADSTQKESCRHLLLHLLDKFFQGFFLPNFQLSPPPSLGADLARIYVPPIKSGNPLFRSKVHETECLILLLYLSPLPCSSSSTLLLFYPSPASSTLLFHPSHSSLPSFSFFFSTLFFSSIPLLYPSHLPLTRPLFLV